MISFSQKQYEQQYILNAPIDSDVEMMLKCLKWSLIPALMMHTETQLDIATPFRTCFCIWLPEKCFHIYMTHLQAFCQDFMCSSLKYVKHLYHCKSAFVGFFS